VPGEQWRKKKTKQKTKQKKALSALQVIDFTFGKQSCISYCPPEKKSFTTHR